MHFYITNATFYAKYQQLLGDRPHADLLPALHPWRLDPPRSPDRPLCVDCGVEKIVKLNYAVIWRP